MKKNTENNDDIRKILREEIQAYFTGEGKDALKTIIRAIVRDEVFGDERGEYQGDASTATRGEIRRLIRLELYGDGA